MAIHDHTYGHLLQKGVKVIMAVHVQVVGVPHLLLEIITTANQDTMVLVIFLMHSSDPLWDGTQCESEGSCCSAAPWFTVDLVNSTNDDIEVRICSSFYADWQDTPVHLLELYIQ